jgi:alkylhydroperoxidase family enzyme
MRCEPESYSSGANACFEPETSSLDELPAEASSTSVHSASADGRHTSPCGEGGAGGAPAVSARAANPERGASGQSGSEEAPSEVDPTALEMLAAMSLVLGASRMHYPRVAVRAFGGAVSGGISGYISGSANGTKWESAQRSAVAGAAASVFHPGGVAGTAVTAALSNVTSATVPETVPVGIAVSTLVAALTATPEPLATLGTLVLSTASGISSGLAKGAVLVEVRERDRVAAQ